MIAKKSKWQQFKAKFRKDYRYFLLFTGIALIGFLLFYFYPIMQTLVLSFTNKSIFDTNTEFIG